MFLGQLIATLGVDTAGLVTAVRSMKQFETRMNASVARINAKLRTTGTAMKKFGRGMTMYMTAPLALVGGAAFKMHMDFEASMSKIVGLVGVGRMQVDEWSKDIIKMAPALGRAPKELADAMFFITSAGIRGANALDVLEKSAKASVSGLGEVKAVADLVTSAMNAYGAATLNAQMATDVLTATVREGKAQADALATSMGMVLPIASNMAVQFHEVGAAVAAMTRTGTSAQTASMQLRQILASLLKPTQQAEKALWGMGTSSAALRKTIREDGLLAALSKIKDLSEEYGDTVMSTVFPNIRALSGVLDIMGANLEDNIKIFDSLSQAVGSAEKAFEAAAETTEHKWNVAITSAKTALTILGGTVSKEFIPILTAFTEKIQKIILWFEDLNEAQRRTIVRIGGLVAAIGPLSLVLGFLVGNVLPGLISLVIKVTSVFRILTIVMMQNPFIALAVGVTAVTVLLARYIKKAEKASIALDAKAIEDAAKQIDKLSESIIELSEAQRRAKIVERINFLKENILLSAEETKKWKKELIKADNALFTTWKRLSYLGAELLLSTETTKSYRRELQELEENFWDIVKAGDKVETVLKKIQKVVVITSIDRPAAPGRITGIGRFPTPPGEKLAAQAKLIADAWVKAAEAGKLYDTTVTQALLNMEGAMDRNIARWDGLNNKMREGVGVLLQVGMGMESLAILGATLVDRRISKLDEQYRRDIAGAKDSASQKMRIEEAYNEKRNALLRKAAIMEKIAGLFNIAINTAKGVMDAMSKTDTIPLVPWIIAMGSLQAAIVMAQPIPQFGEGAIVTRPTLAMIGEKGPEAVVPLNKQTAIGGDIYITLEPAFSNEELYYRVKEVDRKHGNSF